MQFSLWKWFCYELFESAWTISIIHSLHLLHSNDSIICTEVIKRMYLKYPFGKQTNERSDFIKDDNFCHIVLLFFSLIRQNIHRHILLYLYQTVIMRFFISIWAVFVLIFTENCVKNKLKITFKICCIYETSQHSEEPIV